ncbi:MAG: hypothetical protein A2Y89_03490 [Chloroflexi bacterium RBG_13_51_18]|nr:MAG: hypothetical protein A2Y89_03490 [Chloroflexi bacterium RBG_13_51_18]
MVKAVTRFRKPRGSWILILWAVVTFVLGGFMQVDTKPVELADKLTLVSIVLASILLIAGIWQKITANRASYTVTMIIVILCALFFVGFAVFSLITGVSEINATFGGRSYQLEGAGWTMGVFSFFFGTILAQTVFKLLGALTGVSTD